MCAAPKQLKTDSMKKTIPFTTAPSVEVPRLVRYRRGRWLYSLDLESEEWNGCHSKLEDSIEQAAQDLRELEMPPGTPIYFVHGIPTPKRECDDMGVDWPYYQVHREDAIKLVLPNV